MNVQQLKIDLEKGMILSRTTIVALVDLAITQQERFATAQAAEPGFDIAKLLHYPQHWDTAAYPTLESAVWEALSGVGCSECGNEPAPVAEAMEPITLSYLDIERIYAESTQQSLRSQDRELVSKFAIGLVNYSNDYYAAIAQAGSAKS